MYVSGVGIFEDDLSKERIHLLHKNRSTIKGYISNHVYSMG